MIARVAKAARVIPETSFTEDEARELERLLALVAKDKGFWPTQECFLAADKAVPRWAAEVVIADSPFEGVERTARACAILRKDEAEQIWARFKIPRVLLVMYGTEGGKGAFKPHWTLPGSRGGLTESIADTVKRVGEKELGGATVTYSGKILFDHKWQQGEHPDGAQVLSLYTECAAGDVVETENRKFFPIDALPDLDKSEGVHVRNLNAYFRKQLPQFFSRTN